jgi:DNA end-binding protein Ku
MPRAIWSGTISFGLVMVPVKLYSATSRKDVRFHQLHADDGVRIQQKRVCPADGQEVPIDRIVKGYEWTPGHYVVVTPEELAALAPTAGRTIEIEEFVDLADIDALYWESSYYLVPDRGAAKPYALLQRAMRDAGRVAIGRVALRSKEYLAAIRPVAGGALVLSTMLYADEVVRPESLEGLPGEDVELAPRELAIAGQLIESLATGFEPERHRDAYRDRLLELIRAKAEGEQVVVQPAQPEAAPVADLMAALEESLAAARRRAEAAPAAKPAAKPRARKAARKG